MLYRPAPKYRAWWDTKLSTQYGARKRAIPIVAWHIVYTFGECPLTPANDRDHLPW
jgi:hypothetical protein